MMICIGYRFREKEDRPRRKGERVGRYKEGFSIKLSWKQLQLWPIEAARLLLLPKDKIQKTLDTLVAFRCCAFIQFWKISVTKTQKQPVKNFEV